MNTPANTPNRPAYPMRNYKAVSAVLAALACAGLSSPAFAAQLTWIGNADASLLNGANYVGGNPPISGSDGILFNAAGSVGASLTLGSNFQAANTGGAITFSSTASAYTLGGAGELLIGSGAIVNNSSNAQIFNMAVRRNTGNNFIIGANNGSLIFGNTFNLGATGGTANLAFGTTTGGSIRFDGNITATSGTGAINIVAATSGGAGTVIINGSNNTGLNAITINAFNTLRLGSTTALGSLATLTLNPNSGSSSVTVINDSSGAISTDASLAFTTGGNFIFGESGDTSANNISFAGTAAITADTNRTITINGTGVTVASASTWTNANATTSRTLTINGAGNTFQIGGIGIGAAGETSNRSFTVAGDGNLLVTGGVTNGLGTGTRALTLTGTGTVTINGASDYSGVTTVGADARLLVNGTHTGGNTYTVNGTLGGTGTIGSATILSSTGKLEASTANDLAFTGTLNASAAFGAASPSMSFNLGAPGGTAVSVGGLFTIGTGLLNFDDFAFTTSSGFGAGTYTLFDYGSISGTLGSALTGMIGGLSSTISQDTLNNSIIVTVIPEPSAFAALAGLGALGLVGLRRRRRS